MQTYRIAHELSDNLTMKEYYLKSDVVARDAKIEDDLAFIIGATEWGTEIREKAEHAWNVLRGVILKK